MKTTLDTTFRTGGPPEGLITFESSGDYLSARGDLGPHRVLGGGSNVLVSDEGPQGTIAVLSRPTSGLVDVDGSRARIDATGNWFATAVDLADRGLAGVESLVGIPGSVGGAVVQNIGAYGHEICEVIERVRVVSPADGSTTWLTAGECRFGYRDSLFKSAGRGSHVVLEAEVALRPGGKHEPVYRELAGELERRVPGHAAPGYDLHDVHSAVLALRTSKNMVWHEDDHRTWGAGSFFVNPALTPHALAEVVRRVGDEPPSWEMGPAAHKVSAGWLVERSGFRRGHLWDTVGLAPGHALGLVNRSGRATSAEVLDAANEIGRAVTEVSGLRLMAEPILLGFDAGARLDFDAHIEP